MENSNQKVWYVTGASKGLGLALVKQLLSEGKKVAATSRSIDELKKAIGDADNFLPLQVNLLSEESIEKSIQAAVGQFGRVDVVVNNAGYGLAGALEELTDAEARQNFDINVFGSLNVIRKVLPYLREQQSGHIFNVSSIGGFTGAFPGFGIYCATKFAVQGFTESLAEEAKPFGIKATIVSPGYFRTDFLKGTSLSVPKNQLQEYKTVREVQSAHENEINGNQQGDPNKAALAFIRTADMENPPVHLFLGQDAYAMAEVKIQAVRENMEAVREYAAATGFDN